jgi:hypothetical protein
MTTCCGSAALAGEFAEVRRKKKGKAGHPLQWDCWPASFARYEQLKINRKTGSVPWCL